MAAIPPPTFVHMPAEKKLDRQIDLCRLGARKDNVTVIIERVTERRDGSPRRTPILEITAQGDVCETLAPRLRVGILEHTALAHLDYLDGVMNKRSAAGHARLNELGRITQDYIGAARAERQARKSKKAKHARLAR